jgi:hypothetical protein
MIYKVIIYQWKSVLFQKEVQFDSEIEVNAYALGVRDALLLQNIEVTGYSCLPK